MRTLALLTHAATKKAGAFIRSLGAAPVHPQWQARVEICANCPLATKEGDSVYCGKPFLSKVHREAEDGCGCPIMDKAQDPAEHCPLTPQHVPAAQHGASCGCKWCVRIGI